METTSKKRPFGFYVCSIAFVFERFAFYSAKWLIAVFVVASVANGGLEMTPADAAKMSANLVAFTYLAPVFGGYISDRFVGLDTWFLLEWFLWDQVTWWDRKPPLLAW